MKLSEAYAACKEAGLKPIAAGKIKCTYVVLNDKSGKPIFTLNRHTLPIERVYTVEEERMVIRNGVITSEIYTVEVPYIEPETDALGDQVSFYTVEVPDAKTGLVRVLVSGTAARHIRNVALLAEAQGKMLGEDYRKILDGTVELYARPNAIDWEPTSESEIDYSYGDEPEQEPEPTNKKRNLLLAIAAGLLLLNQ